MASAILAQIAALKIQLVDELQAEYFTDDLSLPSEAFGWDEAAIRAYFEAGGEALPATVEVTQRAAGRGAILCLGDGLTEF